MTTWTRATLFGERFTHRPVEEFFQRRGRVRWQRRNPYRKEPLEAVRAEIMSGRKWRYHHGIDGLAETSGFYRAHAGRVDSMLEMLDGALGAAGIDLPGASILDVAAAEGYAANHLIDRGATDVDVVELNEGNLQRIWQIRALQQQASIGRVGRLDVERADWARALGRTYDVVLALGIVYHMENPMLWLRNLYAATKSVAVVESDTPIYPRNARFRGYGVTYLHRDQVTLSANNVRYITEFRPDRQALAEMLLAAGFQRVDEVAPATLTPCRYFDDGEKSMLIAFR